MGALTLDTLASKLQDMSGTAMKARAVERFPAIMDGSTGLSPALDVTPFGILTRIYAEVTSLIARADPADINGPEDIPDLLLEFIEGLPVVGQFVDLVQAILGEYDGNDEVLLAIQNIFAPIRAFLQFLTGQSDGFPTPQEVITGFGGAIKQPISQLVELLITALDLIPVIGEPIGDRVEYLASIFGLMKSNTEGAQFSADHANVGVAQLEAKLASGNVPGGVLIDDTFDRAGSDIGPNYTLSYFGVSAGVVRIGDGNVNWEANGGSDRGCFVRHNTPLGTNNQAVAIVQSTKFPTITNPTHLRLILRADASMTNFVEARFAREGCSIRKVVGGASTTLGTASGRNADGDRWTYKAGTDIDDRNFVLYCNSDVILDVTDTAGPLSLIGASNRFAAFLMFAGTQVIPIFPFPTQQIGPPSIQSFTANDRLAAE